MTELEQRKLEAETRLVEAEAARASAETTRINSERDSEKKSWRPWIVETIKLVGALVIGAGGFVAALTGYQLAEVRKERTELATELLQKKLQESTQLLEAATQKKRELDGAVLTAQAQLDTTRTQLEQLRVQLVTAKGSAPATADTTALDSAIKQTTEIQTAVNTVDTQLRSAKTEDTDIAISARLQQAVEKLFSDDGAVRGAAYDAITKEFRRDPGVVTALLAHARKHMDNENGVYNTVVTLKDLSRAVTQPRKDEINKFCDEAEKLGDRTKKQCEALRKWLDTKR